MNAYNEGHNGVVPLQQKSCKPFREKLIDRSFLCTDSRGNGAFARRTAELSCFAFSCYTCFYSPGSFHPAPALDLQLYLNLNPIPASQTCSSKPQPLRSFSRPIRSNTFGQFDNFIRMCEQRTGHAFCLQKMLVCTYFGEQRTS